MSIFTDLINAGRDYLDSRADSSSPFTSLKLTSMPQQPNGGSNWNDWRGYHSSTRIDYTAEVGDLRTSSLAYAAIQWLSGGLYDARLRVIKYGADRKETEIENHPLTNLLERPNPFYSFQSLMAGFALSWITASEAYFVKVKARAGNVVQLWWEPHWTIRPRWDSEGKEFISYYEILRNGKWIRLEIDDVVAVRRGVDPETRRGMINPNTALIREYYTDSQIIRFASQIMRSGLVPPVIVSLGSKDSPFRGSTAEFKAELQRKMSGDSAGEPMVTAGEANVSKLGFDYTSLGLRELRHIPEERFCAAMGISSHSLKLGASRDASTYNNVKNYLAHDYRSYIVPTQKLMAHEMNVQLLPDFSSSKEEALVWDYSQTALMQPDKIIETKNTTLLYEKGVIDRAEAREATGYKMREEDKGVYYSGTMAKPEEKPMLDDGAKPDDPTKSKKDVIPDSALDSAASYWTGHDSLTPEQRDLMNAKPFINGKVS